MPHCSYCIVVNKSVKTFIVEISDDNNERDIDYMHWGSLYSML